MNSQHQSFYCCSAAFVTSQRPFKTLPNDSSEISHTRQLAELVLPEQYTSSIRYLQYREQCLKGLTRKSGEVNKNMVRFENTKSSDPEYVQRRKKNNEASRRSREAMKRKQDELAIRVQFLEQEVLQLRTKLLETINERDFLTFYEHTNQNIPNKFFIHVHSVHILSKLIVSTLEETMYKKMFD
ncbi:transcription factor atf-2-like [Euwallacea similis]|uniref:transcription factor atf-2-like n=1 Tax=Euwallacea similis TaxID=1736056 RepID=UPI00344BAAA4